MGAVFTYTKRKYTSALLQKEESGPTEEIRRDFHSVEEFSNNQSYPAMGWLARESVPCGWKKTFPKAGL